jgi:hypothetical protein
MQALSGRVLIGGTSGRVEAQYLQELDRRVFPDRYVEFIPHERDLWVFPEDLSAMDPDPLGS